MPSNKKIGKIRSKLADILTKELGFTVYAEDIGCTTGVWNRAIYDVRCWWVYAFNPQDNLKVLIDSFDTMTECVKNGIDWSKHKSTYYEVSSKQKGECYARNKI